jgi:hypothetical protein
MKPTQQQLLITGAIALVSIMGYAIYTDLTRFFPDKKKDKKNDTYH